MKDVPGWEGLYAITSCGKVWSYRSKRFLKTYWVNGYEKVTLCHNYKTKRYRINRLVLMTYNPVEGMENLHAAHIDGIKAHNWLNNLHWTTLLENMNEGSRNERIRKANSKPVYCEELGKVFESGVAAARELGIWQGGISNCCNGRVKSVGGYHFRFLNPDYVDAIS